MKFNLNINFDIKEIFNKIKMWDLITKIILASVCGVFLFSLVCWMASKPGKRYTFEFESVDSEEIMVESRMLPSKKWREAVTLYVDELILGPETERFRPLFSLGTKETFCFVRNHVLYVNLSAEALNQTGRVSKILVGTELFKKNVLKNFSKIKSVEMYIDNKGILEEVN